MNTSFERAANGKDEWLTPPYIIKALGPFDLDPCAPIKRPWNIAANHYTLLDNGLIKEWRGRVWLNPPYGTQTIRWMRRLAEHGHGTALTFARTETKLFFDTIWYKATAMFFLKGRIIFLDTNGKPKLNKNGRPQGSGAPSVLIAYGETDAQVLECCGLPGKYLRINLPGGKDA